LSGIRFHGFLQLNQEGFSVGEANRYRIVFMGTPDFAVPSLNDLMEGPDRVLAVVTQPDRPRGRGRKLTPSPVKRVAQEAGIPVLQPEKAGDGEFLRAMREIAPDIVAVAAYGQIVPQELLDIPRLMAINVHGSLLPKYRGAAPVQWSILNGETETGVTIMQMDAGMDTGPMLLKGSLAIGPDETFDELYARMADLGGRLLVEALKGMRQGTLVATPQPREGVSYAPSIKPEMAQIEWSQPAVRIACQIRAFDSKPGAYTFWEGQRLRLFRPFVVDAAAGEFRPGTVVRTGEAGVVVAAGEGCIGVRELQLPGKRRVPAGDFLRGRDIPPGARFGKV
jgi:methionyl-tRNA formyltransferase